MADLGGDAMMEQCEELEISLASEFLLQMLEREGSLLERVEQDQVMVGARAWKWN